jgi:hypothetical protein
LRLGQCHSGTTYKLITTVGEETANGNTAFKQLEQFVNEHIREGWTPMGGMAVSPVIGPKTVGSTRDNWFVRVAQALVRQTEE